MDALQWTTIKKWMIWYPHLRKVPRWVPMGELAQQVGACGLARFEEQTGVGAGSSSAQ